MSNDAIKVFIRDRAGDFLSCAGKEWRFTDDVAQAHVFDYHADNVAAQLEDAQRDLGVIWFAWPCDPTLLREICDLCGQHLSPNAAIFDGARFLCPNCAPLTTNPPQV